MRPEFFKQLYEVMKVNPKVWALTGDLGYIGFDHIRDEFPDRFINCGAAEQAMLDIAVGLAMEGKIPFTYTITPFYYRGFETIRTYIDHEKLNVKLIGSGRDKDYHVDGYSHDASDIKGHFDLLPNIQQFWPMDTKEMVDSLDDMVRSERPSFMSLTKNEKKGGK